MKLKEMKKLAVPLMIFMTFFTAFGQLLWKLGLNQLSYFSFIGIISNYYMIGGLILYILAAGLMVLALRYGELSVLYPIVSLSFVWVTVLASFFLGENINEFRILGISFILLGVSFLGRSSSKRDDLKVKTRW